METQQLTIGKRVRTREREQGRERESSIGQINNNNGGIRNGTTWEEEMEALEMEWEEAGLDAAL